ncbi:hypothetical protein [Rhodococcoides fascians]|uniref:hypothetical protein n=1 Tax=Rhodococcoides fascians TaxID=1828 RepID=UPI00050CFFA1|nr:hypothetical protein [Rhodococcus fascians]
MTEPTVLQVDRDIRLTTNHISDMEARFVDGDDSITAETIEESKRHLGFLGLRRKRAEKVERERAEAERQAAIDELVADRAEFYSAGLTAVQDAYAAVVAAAGPFMAELEKARAVHAELGSRGRELPEAGGDPRDSDFTRFDDDNFVKFAFTEGVGRPLQDSNGRPLLHALHGPAAQAAHAERVAELDAITEQFERERREMYAARNPQDTELVGYAPSA